MARQVKSACTAHILATAFFSCLAFSASAAEPVEITIGPADKGHAVPKTLWGIFFEDINWSADGGINPEMLANGTMGIAKLRRDGFCSLSDGTITTRRLVFTRGDRLWINADVRAGELKVESSGGLARTFKGVDSTRLEVGRLDPGMEFTLTFTATGGAKLYSFWASDAKGRSRGYLAVGSPESDTLRDLEGASPADTEGASKKGR